MRLKLIKSIAFSGRVDNIFCVKSLKLFGSIL